MIHLGSARRLFGYSDWANATVLDAAAALPDAALDWAFEMGPGSLRRTLLHLWAGESVWLARWMGHGQTRWPDEQERAGVADIRTRMQAVWTERDRYFDSLADCDLAREQVYRDSRGGQFRAMLADMLLQGFTHSTHHRAQAVNMLRRLDAGVVELDYMMWVRRPV